MCGISGYVSFAGPGTLPWAFVNHAIQRLQHRGPDGTGLLLGTEDHVYTATPDLSKTTFKNIPWRPEHNWQALAQQSATLALGHNRLSIYDTSTAGHQPMCSPDQQYWIVFNGAIYNFRALRNELISAGLTFFTQTDTEVILAAYQHWGKDCLQRLEGMFAFVVWDRTSNIIWGARDCTGVKPLYWYQDNNGFAFASEQKAFWQAPGVSTGLRQAGVFANLVIRQLDAHPEGLFEGINALLPGHTFTLNLHTDELTTERYFYLQPTPIEDDQIHQIRSTILHSIDLRRQADVPVGVAVSGGLDSSIIAGAMRYLGAEKINAFTASFPGFTFDESSFANTVAKHVNAEWHTCTPTAADFLTDLQDLIYTQESPIQSASTYAQYALMRLVHETGVKVLLDGQGGDELFAGYHIHQWVRGWELLKRGGLSQFDNTVHISGNKLKDYKLFATQMAKRSILPVMPTAMQWRLLHQPNPMLQFFRKDWVAQERHQLVGLKEPVGNLQDFLHHQYFDSYLGYLLKFEDRNSMRFGIETRVPFADDPNLMALLFSIPATKKLLPGSTKHLLREAMGDLIPDRILSRSDKVGFIAPTNQWLKSSDQWLSAFEYESSFLDTARIRQEKGKFEHWLESDRFSHMLPLLTTALWEQTFSV